MDSSFKKYRTAFGGDPDAFDPSRILSAAMQPPLSPEAPPPGYGPGPQETAGYQPPQPQPSFDVDARLPKPRSVQPQLDSAMAQGEEHDMRRQQKRERIGSMIQGFGSGFTAAANTHGDFGQQFATGMGRAIDVAMGSMQKADERRQVEEARNLEIETMFFNRSVKLQELAQRRKEAEAELAGDLEDRRLRREAAALAGRRADTADARLDEVERHNRENETIARTNAGANVTRAGAARTRAASTAGKAAPRSASEIDAYARKRVYVQFGAMDEQGNIVDDEVKQSIDEQLKRTGGRRNRVQDAYKAARAEATKSTVDPSSEDDSE